MDPFVRNFIRASMVWLCTGVLLGVLMSFSAYALVARPAHMHANLLGFVAMMIFGVAYHVIPRFSGAPLHRPALARLHFWIANIGLLLMVSGWLLRPFASSGTRLLQAGGLLSATGAFLFAYNIWRTLDAARPAGAPLQPVRR
jgi:cytochrome c oxidase cbb3-type subunit 1